MEDTMAASHAGQDQGVDADLREQFDQYVAQQPASLRAAHRLLTLLMAGGVGLFIALLIWSIYASFKLKDVGGLQVMFWWLFTFMLGWFPISLGYGLDTIILRAELPLIVGSGASGKVLSTGPKAVWGGVGVLLGSVAWGALWGGIVYAVFVQNFALAETLLNVIIFLVVAIALLQAIPRMFGQTLRALTRG